MLNNIPIAINKMVRNVVINHPNTYNCVVVRKRVLRPDPIVGGLPTIGGAMVLSSEDEDDIEYELLGNGYALPAEMFDKSLMMDRQDANNGYQDEFRYLVEPEDENEFTIKKQDIFYLIIDSVRLAFEIVGIETTSNIPPFTQRYACNRRDDLHFAI
jgi:hypothetical protein